MIGAAVAGKSAHREQTISTRLLGEMAIESTKGRLARSSCDFENQAVCETAPASCPAPTQRGTHGVGILNDERLVIQQGLNDLASQRRR